MCASARNVIIPHPTPPHPTPPDHVDPRGTPRPRVIWYSLDLPGAYVCRRQDIHLSPGVQLQDATVHHSLSFRRPPCTQHCQHPWYTPQALPKASAKYLIAKTQSLEVTSVFQIGSQNRLHLTFLGSSGASPVQRESEFASHCGSCSSNGPSDCRYWHRLQVVYNKSHECRFKVGSSWFKAGLTKLFRVQQERPWISQGYSGSCHFPVSSCQKGHHDACIACASLRCLTRSKIDSIVKSNHSSSTNNGTHQTCVASIHGEISTWWSGKHVFPIHFVIKEAFRLSSFSTSPYAGLYG